MEPIKLPSNQPPKRFYKGGHQISKFRGEPSQVEESYTPEDWIASTTSCHGHSCLGQTKLPTGVLLKDEIEHHPVEWLGSDHINNFGVDTKLLVKLLDAGQRLPVHAHPHVTWARANIGASHGKSEAWYILTPGEVFLGLRKGISAKDLLTLVHAQDIETMLGMMHRVQVKPHQTVYVPPGLLHAVGQGVFFAEVQEPEDLSILLEWRDFAIDGLQDGHLGLGYEAALGAVEQKGRTGQEISSLVSEEGTFGSLLVKGAEEYFALERLAIKGEEKCRAGFAVVIVLAGNFEVSGDYGKTIELGKGDTAVVPHGAGTLKLCGTGEILVARPPVVE